MPEEPITNPNSSLADAQPVNGGVVPPNGGAIEKPAADAAVGAAPPNGGATDLAAKLEAGDLTSYLMLRQSIDLFEATALAFYASGKTVEARENRALDVRDSVTRFKDNLPPDGCPPGQRRDSNGNCIPNEG
jgi:hypothetical protein